MEVCTIQLCEKSANVSWWINRHTDAQLRWIKEEKVGIKCPFGLVENSHAQVLIRIDGNCGGIVLDIIFSRWLVDDVKVQTLLRFQRFKLHPDTPEVVWSGTS